MFEMSFHLGCASLVIFWFLYRGAAALYRKCIDWKYEVKQLFFLANLLVIYRFTFHPFAKVDGQIQPLVFDAANAWPFRVSLTPFSELDCFETRKDLLLNLIGNFAMFIPTGIMAPLIYRRRNTFGKVVFTGFLLSLAIEILQLPFFSRVSDIDDLILNTAGCAAGYGILVILRWAVKKREVCRHA